MLKNVGSAVIRNSYFILESDLQVAQAQIEGRSNGKKEKKGFVESKKLH